MKQKMKRINRKYISLRTKLLGYFMLFGAIILIVLWIFQIFMIKPLYTMSKSYNVEQCMQKITRAVEANKNVLLTLDNVASHYSFSVYLFESGGGEPRNVIVSSYENPSAQLNVERRDILRYYKNAVDNGGTYTAVEQNDEKDLEKRKLEMIKKSASSSDSANFNIHMSKGDPNESLISAKIIKNNSGTERFVLITSSIMPLNTTLEIIQKQLMLVSIAFVVLSLIFSVYASMRIAKPISETNRAAKELAKKNYDTEFNATGYLEVEELNDTLQATKTELAATEKLQQELIANISHDLRTPLTMITGYAEVMRDLPGENTPENVQVIIDEATRLSTLVNDLLDLSKLQSGAIQTVKKDFCLTDSVKDIFKRYTKLIEQENYTLSFDYDEDVYINADELRISQVIYNMINNAVNHCGDDKTVLIAQKVNNQKVVIEITDHGEGIPADKLPYIWDRYYKVDKEHRRGVIGSGLGLSIVKSILDAHNARYGVRSTLGKGSTFWFELNVVSVKKKED
ncbi:MAG: HAMP domain-containing sensor histidine kinase [Ruminococcus sp.]|nr:HAMP domain-containing sensor histidine kinase [Ruminococcus sp.]